MAKICSNCGLNLPKSGQVCPNCGHKRPMGFFLAITWIGIAVFIIYVWIKTHQT